jgi:hypothetical protein
MKSRQEIALLILSLPIPAPEDSFIVPKHDQVSQREGFGSWERLFFITTII